MNSDGRSTRTSATNSEPNPPPERQPLVDAPPAANWAWEATVAPTGG
ncbi:MAG TPA: hypothetical protein VGF84_22750 [Micromonosporaceae bacterium]|jgi:hypothetical protein